MKIRVSYRKESKLEFLRFVDYPNLAMARQFIILTANEVLKVHSKVNLILEYQEIIDAQELTTKIRMGAFRRMILFIKHCPNFKISKLPYYKSGNYPELFQAEYLENEVVINLEKNKTYYQGSMLFHITLK